VRWVPRALAVGGRVSGFEEAALASEINGLVEFAFLPRR
jgi:hypothetical protein